MIWIKLISSKALGWAMAAIGALIAFLSVYQRGKHNARNEVAAEAAKSNQRMLDAAVAAPKEKDDVVKDLRAGRF
jgi:hypothetical protein